VDQNDWIPLEMAVSRSLRENTTLFVNHGLYYIDPIEETVRATDVVARVGDQTMSGHIPIHVVFVIECKSKPAPWIVFVDPYHLESFRALRTLSDMIPNDLGNAFIENSALANDRGAKEPPLLGLNRVPGYEICEKRSDGKNRTDPAFGAVRQVASASIGLFEEVRSNFNTSVIIPIVVTSGLLYEAWLDNDGGLHAEKVTRSVVSVKISGNHNTSLVHVATAADLDNLARDCESTVEALTRKKSRKKSRQ
jgi:hypothetical protein